MNEHNTVNANQKWTKKDKAEEKGPFHVKVDPRYLNERIILPLNLDEITQV